MYVSFNVLAQSVEALRYTSKVACSIHWNFSLT